MKTPIALRALPLRRFAEVPTRRDSPSPVPFLRPDYFWLFLPQKIARALLPHVESVGKMLRHPPVGYTRLYPRLTHPVSKIPPNDFPHGKLISPSILRK
jgi:hypothetical protein